MTAIALSHDHTFVAAGHATGHIQLFDLSKPHVPARTVPATTLAAVASGRKEGHLQGSRIVSIGFVAGRHTAIVSADHTGLAFYHSLGKALFFEASDVLRILGKYANEEAVVPGKPPAHRRRARRTNTILAMAPLPLGTVPHTTDAYNVTALLTAAKLVIVGLKPSPKTWYRKHREEADEHMGKARFRAALAWFPSVVPNASADRAKAAPGKKDNSANKGAGQEPPPTTPMLVYSWGSRLHLLLVSELKTREQFTSERTGKLTTVEVGRLVFEEKAQWQAQDDVHAVQWLNTKVGSFHTHLSARRGFFFCPVAERGHFFSRYSKFLPSLRPRWRCTTYKHVHLSSTWISIHLCSFRQRRSPTRRMERSHIRTRQAISPIAYAHIKAKFSFS